MDAYVLISFIWFVGWLYSCGEHRGNKETIINSRDAGDIDNIDFGGMLQYVILFFGWPHYLGYKPQ